MQNNKIELSEELENAVYEKFIQLTSLKQKLIVYAKLMHGNIFKAYNNDIFGLNKRTITKIYRTFIDSLKEKVNGKNSKKKNKQKSKTCY